MSYPAMPSASKDNKLARHIASESYLLEGVK
jgi:hypothetical protein